MCKSWFWWQEVKVKDGHYVTSRQDWNQARDHCFNKGPQHFNIYEHETLGVLVRDHNMSSFVNVKQDITVSQNGCKLETTV